jgi:quercetin dioxygenase-like cupin family protein
MRRPSLASALFRKLGCQRGQRRYADLMTWHGNGYALAAGASLEDLDMGGGSVLSIRVAGEQSRGLVTVIEGVVERGGPPLHVHQVEDEVVVVLDGELSYQIGDERGTVTAGGLLWFPRSVAHAVANLSAHPCRFLTIVTPAGIESFFRAQSDYLASLPPGAAPDPQAMTNLPGADLRPVLGPPLA